MRLHLAIALSLLPLAGQLASPPIQQVPWPTTTIGFHFSDDPSPEWKEHQVEIRRALAEWERRTCIRFVEAGAAGRPQTIDFRWVGPEWIDPSSKSPMGSNAARTFMPPPNSIEPDAGDVLFNAMAPIEVLPVFGWGKIDMFDLALHEVGHAIGLTHSQSPASIMYLGMSLDSRRLDDETIWKARALYGCEAK